jgi:hypothetical protein
MKQSPHITFQVNDLEGDRRPYNKLDLVILPKEEIIEIIKALDGLKRKLKPLLDTK